MEDRKEQGESSTAPPLAPPEGLPTPEPLAGAKQLKHRHHHHHPHEYASDMRESDGDILEVGITQPSTPVLTSLHQPSRGSPDVASSLGRIRPASPDRLPLLPEAAAVSDGEFSGVEGDDIFASPARGSLESSPRNESGFETPPLPSKPMRPAYRRALSGDDYGWQAAPVGGSSRGKTLSHMPAAPSGAADGGGDGSSDQDSHDAAMIETTSGTQGTSARIVPLDASPSAGIGADGRERLPRTLPPRPTAKECREHPADAVERAAGLVPSQDIVLGAPEVDLSGSSGSRMSIERHMKEMVQFAEAVGEAPPTDPDEVRCIMEEDNDSSSDDDSDSDTEEEEEEDVVEIAASDVGAGLPSLVVSTRVSVVNAVPSAQKDEDAVESSFRRDLTLIEPESPFVVKPRHPRPKRDGSKSGTSLERPVNNQESSILALPPLTTPGDMFRRRSTFREELEVEDEEIEGEEKKVDKSLRRLFQDRRARLMPATKEAPRPTSGIRSTHHLTLLSKEPLGPNRENVYEPPDSSGLVKLPKGILEKQLEVTSHGISRGNYARLHRKAWLEVSDKYHRYGKNLRGYYKHWESLGHPSNKFFDWLDSKGEAAGQPLPNLPECPRSNLDSDTVLYVTNPDVQERYALSIATGVVNGRDLKGSVSIDDDNDSFEGDAIFVDSDEVPVKTGPEGWIFVLRDHVLYAGQKVTAISGRAKQRFHHSSFFGGKAVEAAGIIITDDHGRLRRMYPHSGHYRPTEAHMQRMLFFLQSGGFDLTSFEVDTQQILHVSRSIRTAPKGGTAVDTKARAGAAESGDRKDNGRKKKEEKKKKKVDSLHLKPALYVACFLAHKARMIGEGVFAQIHDIRTEGVGSVSEALDAVDEGGFWKKLREYITIKLA